MKFMVKNMELDEIGIVFRKNKINFAGKSLNYSLVLYDSCQ